jgi:hypothetical protein
MSLTKCHCRTKEYFRRYLEISEAAYAVPRVVVLLSPIEPAAGELDA